MISIEEEMAKMFAEKIEAIIGVLSHMTHSRMEEVLLTALLAKHVLEETKLHIESCDTCLESMSADDLQMTVERIITSSPEEYSKERINYTFLKTTTAQA